MATTDSPNDDPVAFDALIVGAGISGLACAQALTDAGLRVRVYEKSRGRGGRCATRRVNGIQFDSGAQYVTPRSAGFRRAVERWKTRGGAAAWNARIGALRRGHFEPVVESKTHHVGLPGMSGLARELATGLDIATEQRVVALEREGSGWRLIASGGPLPGTAPRAIVAAPAPQAAEILLGVHSRFAAALAQVAIAPCLATLLHFSAPVATDMDGIFFEAPDLAWAARDSSKPGRPRAECWVLHGTSAFSAAHLEEPAERFTARMRAAFARQLGIELPSTHAIYGHAWRYALVREPLAEEFLLAAPERLGACGDWSGTSRIETAFQSGRALARALLKSG